jgi:hypothetical protein
MKQWDMLWVLEQIEAKLGVLLSDPPEAWASLDIDYEPPRVERVWRQVHVSGQDYRLYLHRIHPCEQALFHPHPWPSAVKVCSGSYEMEVGHGAGQDKPPVTATVRLTWGSSYEMMHPDGWHSVRPLGGVSHSLMVTGATWDRWSPKPSGYKLGALKAEQKLEILEAFKLWSMEQR